MQSKYTESMEEKHPINKKNTNKKTLRNYKNENSFFYIYKEKKK